MERGAHGCVPKKVNRRQKCRICTLQLSCDINRLVGSPHLVYPAQACLPQFICLVGISSLLSPLAGVAQGGGLEQGDRPPWRQDVCRHTFATYHAAHFRNFAALQMEVGHRDSSLLRTRYVYAGNGTEASARSYFECTKYNVQCTN